jgi:xanthine/uracil permease
MMTKYSAPLGYSVLVLLVWWMTMFVFGWLSIIPILFGFFSGVLITIVWLEAVGEIKQ